MVADKITEGHTTVTGSVLVTTEVRRIDAGCIELSAFYFAQDLDSTLAAEPFP